MDVVKKSRYTDNIAETLFHFDEKGILLKKGINRFSFSIGVLLVLLHKYSSFVQDRVFLRIRLPKPSDPSFIELKYALSGNQTFLSVCRQVQEEAGRFFKKYYPSHDFTSGIQWIVDSEEEQTNYSYKVRLSIHPDCCETLF